MGFDIPERITVQEACDLLRISRQTLYKRRKAGAITPIKDGSKVLFLKEEILRYSQQGWSK